MPADSMPWKRQPIWASVLALLCRYFRPLERGSAGRVSVTAPAQSPAGPIDILGPPMKQMYHPDDLAAMDPLVLMRNLDHVRMTSRRLSYILQQQVHLYTPEANKMRGEIDQYVEAERQIEWEMARRGLRA